jgi:protease-4
MKITWPFRRHKKNTLPSPDDPHWERALLNQMALEFLHDQRRRRWWNNLFKIAVILYLAIAIIPMLVVFSDDVKESMTGTEHTAIIDIEGVIAADKPASADRIVTALRKAFETDEVKGIILRINSPGGSPVQSGYINKEIKRLREKYPNTPLYAVAADICASGAYYVAVAADKIYVDPATLIGSIGVRIDGFGFHRALDDLGIERRLLTAGAHKGIFDPFLPLSADDETFIRHLLEGLHKQFISAVQQGRGDRLQGGDELFSGLFWTGEEGITLGLADSLGSAGYVAREVIGAEKMVKYSKKSTLLEELSDYVGSMMQLALQRAFSADKTMPIQF